MKYIIVFVFLVVFILSIRLVIFFTTQASLQAEQRVDFSTTLFSDPKEYYGQQTFKAQGLTIYLPSTPKIHYGQTVRIEGTVEKKKIVLDNNENRGNKVEKIQFFVKMQKIRLVKNPLTPLLSFIYNLRQRFSATFYRYLPYKESQLLLGIVFGIKDIDSDFYAQLQATGVLHVIAASGMNVTMAGAFILTFLGRFLRRQIALVVTIILIIFYATLSGLDPSIVRATIMATFAFGAQIFGRQNSSYLALFLAASGMMIYDPALVKSVGFQLSVAATIGIVAIKPALDRIGKGFSDQGTVSSSNEKKVSITRLWSFFADDLNTTLAAQIATLPIIIFTFGTYAPVSILVNLLVLWTVPYLMVLGGTAALISLITYHLSLPFLYLAYPMLFYFHQVINIFSNFSQTVEFDSIPISFVIGYYLILISIVILLNKKQNNKN